MVIQKLTAILTIISLVVGIIVGVFVIAEKFPALIPQAPTPKAQAEQQPPRSPPPATGTIEKKHTTRSEPEYTTVIEDLISLFGHKPARR